MLMELFIVGFLALRLSLHENCPQDEEGKLETCVSSDKTKDRCLRRSISQKLLDVLGHKIIHIFVFFWSSRLVYTMSYTASQVAKVHPTIASSRTTGGRTVHGSSGPAAVVAI